LFPSFSRNKIEKIRAIIARIEAKLIFFIFITKIIAIIAKIRELKVAVLDTQIVENKRVEVKIEPKNEPIVEKNRSFQIFSPAFSQVKISESNGIV
jgi:hypothetical protein